MDEGEDVFEDSAIAEEVNKEGCLWLRFEQKNRVLLEKRRKQRFKRNWRFEQSRYLVSRKGLM